MHSELLPCDAPSLYLRTWRHRNLDYFTNLTVPAALCYYTYTHRQYRYVQKHTYRAWPPDGWWISSGSRDPTDQGTKLKLHIKHITLCSCMKWSSNHMFIGWWHPNITLCEYYFVASHMILCMMGVCHYPVRICVAGLCVWSRRFVCVCIYVCNVSTQVWPRSQHMSHFL